jgi:hypothetical protein
MEVRESSLNNYQGGFGSLTPSELKLECLNMDQRKEIVPQNRVFPHRMNTFNNHSHDLIKDQYTDIFTWLQPSKMETIHIPNQHNHLRQYISAKEKYFTREFLAIDHQQMTLHAL